jgi:hypothetical protein
MVDATPLYVPLDAVMDPSSTYNLREQNLLGSSSSLFHFSAMRRRGKVYTAERIGERGEPCGVPSSVTRRAPVSPLKTRVTDLPVRKDVSHLQKEGGKPRISKR